MTVDGHFIITNNLCILDIDSDDDDETCGIRNVRSLSVRYAISKSHSGKIAGANLSYLTRGLMWAPSYMLRQDTQQKRLTLQGMACLLCDLPFFKGESIDSVALVAGQPKMECQNISDPLASGVSAADFINELGINDNQSSGARGVRGRGAKVQKRMAPMMMQCNSFGAGGSFPEAAMESAEGISDGENMDDLYFYKLKNVPLNYNRPMSLPFLQLSTPEQYHDVYFFDLNNKGSGEDETLIEATHAITFKNTSGQPFTTAPVSVLIEGDRAKDDMDIDQPKKERKENNFLVQGLMKFTGPNKIATIEITKALDVEGKFVIETSKDRTVEAKKKMHNDDYELVSVQKTGTVVISNTKKEEIKCKVDHLLYGQLEKSDPSPMEVTERHNSRVYSHQQNTDLNNTAKYVWEIKVPAKGKAELVFTYHIKEWIRGEQTRMKK